MRFHGAYQTRPIRFQELWEPNGWRIKVYGIAYARDAPDDRLARAIKRAALDTLPTPAVNDYRYGLGFVCAHHCVRPSNASKSEERHPRASFAPGHSALGHRRGSL